MHCPAGSNLPVPCNPGYFTNMSQASECLVCPEGFYCVPEEVVSGMVTLIRGWREGVGDRAAPPAGSNLPVPCNPGYFTNMSQASECLVCPEGFYCVPEEVVSGIVTLIRGWGIWETLQPHYNAIFWVHRPYFISETVFYTIEL